jgi:hypothetical protein
MVKWMLVCAGFILNVIMIVHDKIQWLFIYYMSSVCFLMTSVCILLCNFGLVYGLDFFIFICNLVVL